MNKQPINALTIDVEDGVNQAMRNFFGQDIAPTNRVVENTKRLLDLFEKKEVVATFFILGEVAKAFPELVKNIASKGHELGIHGYSHKTYYKLSRQELVEEITTAKKLVEDAAGIEVVGHRAPEFSIGKNNLWVLDELLEAGIKYDSSIFPTSFGRYAWPSFSKDIDYYTTPNNQKIIEAPLSVFEFAGKNFPACGGSYMRLFPFLYTNKAIAKIQKQRPINIYMHPQEIDMPPYQDFYMKLINASPFKKRMQIKKYWINRSSVYPKLTRLLNRYDFTSLRDVINSSLKINI